MNQFAEFRVPKAIFYGRDSLTELGKQALQLGKKALLVSDRVMSTIGNVKRCEEYLHECGISSIPYLNVNTEPTDQHVAEALDTFLSHKCDLIIGLGGGSCIDAAKAVAVVATNGGYIGDYMGGKKEIIHDSIPFIAIPTTAGTGSEVTSVTVISNTKDDIKMMIKHPAFLPTVAIVDPMLSLTTPPHVTAATGVDALCHAIEAFISRRAQPMTDMLALTAIELILQNIRIVYENGNDIDAREKMALASMQAGMAFPNASVTLVHGMSRPIGALFHVPHGVSNAMLLPAVLEFSKENAIQRLATIGKLMAPELQGQSDEKLAEITIREIKRLCKDLNIPNMKSWGIDEDAFAQQVSKMATDAIDSGSPGNNPRVPTHQEIVELYYHCYDYQF